MFRRCDGIGRRAGLKIQSWRQGAGSTPATGTIKNPFCHWQKGFFNDIRSYWNGGYIFDMISASRMIYALRMEERILYHICNTNISYGSAVYHIAW